MRVLRADELDRSPGELDRARRGTRWPASSAVHAQSSARSSPTSVPASGTTSHSASARSRCASASARPKTACASRAAADRRGHRLLVATRRRPVRRQLRRRCGAAARELVCEPRVQPLALAGQDRRVDRLRQERVAEAEAAGRLVGDEDPVLDRPAQRLAHLALRQPGDRAQQRVGDVTSGRRGEAQQALRRRVEPATRCSSASRRPRGSSPLSPPAAARSSSAKKGLPSERATIASVSAAGGGASAPAASSAVNSSVLERSELEHERRARAPDAVAKPAHALGRRTLVRAVGREQQDRPVVNVVREEDDEIEGRRVGPVQVLEHEQHGCGGCAVAEQRERLLEHPQLRAAPARPIAPTGRRASTSGW